MKSEELEAKVNMLEAKLQRTEDIEAIKKLQRAYSYYLQHWQEDEIMNLFSKRPDISQ